jgi:hypothetical protein
MNDQSAILDGAPVSAARAVQLGEGIELLNGQMFDFFHPERTELELEEIIHTLSNVCRFAGHVHYFFSVAQHLLNATYLAPPGHRRDAGLHDTSEGFTNDIVTPLKFAIPTFGEIERIIEPDMARRFRFRYPLSPEVKLVDLQLLAVEKSVLKPSSSHWAVLDGIPFEHIKVSTLPYWLERIIHPFRRKKALFMGPMTPKQAKRALLKRLNELQHEELRP